MILCFSHFTHTFDFPGAANGGVNLTVPAHPPCPRESSTASRRRCSAVPLPTPGLSSLDFLPSRRSCPANPFGGHGRPPRARGAAQGSRSGRRCHCQPAAASQAVYFWNSLNFTVKDVPEVVRKSSGGTEHLSACFLTHCSDSVSKP